jgi:hypothetical protein
VIAFYFVAALMIGVPSDTFLARLKRTALGTALLGFIVLIPVVVVANFTLIPRGLPPLRLVYAIIILGSIYGIGGGLIAWFTSPTHINKKLLDQKMKEISVERENATVRRTGHMEESDPPGPNSM